MSIFSGPEDIYEELVDKVSEDEEWLLGLVAFAVIEEQKIEWMKHQTKNGEVPSTEDIKNWYKQQPSEALLRARDTAEARLTNYAQAVINTSMVDLEKGIKEDIIVGEIREIKKFWPQFGVNLAGSLASAFLLAILLITIYTVFVYNDISPVDIGTGFGEQLKGE